MTRRILLAVAAVVLTLVVGTAALTAAWLAGVRVPFASGTTWMKVEKMASADNAASPSGTFFIALIGNDAREGRGPSRGDALHVVGVNPATNTATILNVPRDTCWNGGIVNRAHNDGPRAQADALGQLLGVGISYVVSVNFPEFMALVDGMGGVQIDIPFEMNDAYSGAYFTPGPQRVDGRGALAFSRDRHDFGRGDIQRSENQGLLILAGLRTLQAEAKGAAGEFKVAALLARHAQLDGLGISDVWRLGRIAFRLDPNAVRNVTIPVGGGGCLSLGGDAAGLFADFADDATLQAH
jgi:LCP family protein required for cell wall assembly